MNYHRNSGKPEGEGLEHNDVNHWQMDYRTGSRKRRTLHQSGLVAGVGLALLLAACGSSSSTAASTATTGGSGTTAAPATTAASLTTVKVSGLVPIEPVNPFLNAEATGAFAKEGIKLDLSETAAGVQGIPLLASGQVQVLVGGLNAGVYSAIESGIKFLYVGDISTTNGSLPSPAALDVTTKPVNGQTITSVSQLKGLTIGVNGGPGATGAYLLGALLAQNGLNLSQVKVINVTFPNMQKAMETGAVQAVIAAPPFNTKMEAAGDSKAITPVPGGLPGISVFYSPTFAKTPAAQKFFDALVMGSQNLQGAAKTSPANLAILGKATSFTLAQLQSLPFSDYPVYECPSSSAFTTAEKVYTDGGVLKLSQNIAPTGVVDKSFCTAAQQQG